MVMLIAFVTDDEGKIISLDDVEGKEKIEVEQEFTEDEYDIFYQNFRCYKYVDGKVVRFNEEEDLEAKQRFIERIRRKRKSALSVYDIYDKDCIKGKRERDPEIEAWYQEWLDLPETYNNNIPYHKQIPKLPEGLKYYIGGNKDDS